MTYVDGFLTPVVKDRLDEYRELAELSASIWMEHGALHYMETISDDVPIGEHTDFYKAVDLQEGEIVVLSWIIYASKEDRDAILAKAMADPRMPQDISGYPFDGKRMMWGGFKPIVER